MAVARKTILKGINEVGFKRANADVSLGRTTVNGATIAITGTDQEVETGQSTMLEMIYRTADRINVTVRLMFVDLKNLADALGMADAALTGDLQAATPTAEVLAIAENALGAREETLYILTPGPKSTRRYEFARVKARAGLTIETNRDNTITLEATFGVLRPTAGGNAVTITDAI